MQGNISEGVLPGLLRELYVGRQSGFLRFSRGVEDARVLFFDGRMVRAETSIEALRMGEVLVSHDLLSQHDLDQATEMVVRDKARLGKILLDLGIMDREQLEEGLALHLREVLLAVFSWSEGSYEFVVSERPDPKECDITSKLSTGEMILEAVKRVNDPDIVRYAMGDIDRIIGLSSDPLLRFQNIGLTPTDGYIVSRIDGTTSVRELIQLMPADADDVMRSLFGLLSSGILEFLPLPPKVPAAPRPLVKVIEEKPSAPAAPPPPPAAPPPPPAPTEEELALQSRRQSVQETFDGLKTKNHFEILGIPKASSEVQVKEAYFRLAKAYHPDVQRDPGMTDLKSKLEAIFIRLGQAYEVLRNPKTRGPYESDLAARAPKTFPQAQPNTPGAPPEPMAKQDPDLLLRNADKLMKEEKFWDAIQILEQAVGLAEGRQRQKARVLLGRCYLKNPKWVHRAEEVLQIAVKEDPSYSEPYLVLGGIYKSGGLKSRAVSMFRKVVEIKPESEEAQRELAALEPKPSEESPAPPSGGRLKKFFGRS